MGAAGFTRVGSRHSTRPCDSAPNGDANCSILTNVYDFLYHSVSTFKAAPGLPMNIFVSLFQKNKITIAVWLAIILIISVVVQQNRARQAGYEGTNQNPTTNNTTVQT